MTAIGSGAAAGIGRRASGVGPPPASDAERLRATARQLEGVFVEQMFKAMRETVPDGGALSGGSGEEMFTGMLDQSLANEVPGRWSNGLAEALYRQLQKAAGIPEGNGERGMGGASATPDSRLPTPDSLPLSSPPLLVPILDPGTSTSAAPARALLTEPQ